MKITSLITAAFALSLAPLYAEQGSGAPQGEYVNIGSDKEEAQDSKGKGHRGEGRPEGKGPRGEGRPEGKGPRGEGRPEGKGPRGEGKGPKGPRGEGKGPRGEKKGDCKPCKPC